MKRTFLFSFLALVFSFLAIFTYQRSNSPLVSVVMLTYQRDNLLPNAIVSILNQTNTDFELIILDDGSTDNTINIVKSFNDKRIRYFRNKKNMGIAYSRNKVLSKARGKYVMIMDDDDVSINTRIEKQVTFLENNPKIDVVAGQISGFERIPNSHNEIAASLINKNNVGNANTMFRRDFIIKHGIKYANLSYGEDWHFWLQMLFKGAKFASINDDVLTKDISSSKHYTPNYSNTDKVVFDLIGNFFSPNDSEKFFTSSPCDRVKMIKRTKIISDDFINGLISINCL
jgi:glycosyltransferase involved in cell wall biosynthesis